MTQRRRKLSAILFKASKSPEDQPYWQQPTVPKQVQLETESYDNANGTIIDLCAGVTCPSLDQCMVGTCDSQVGPSFFTAGYNANKYPLKCEKAQATQSTMRPRNITVSCCDNYSVGSRPGCLSGVDYPTASAHCASFGLRLCTVAEFNAEAVKNKGCGFDNLPNWLLDSCEGCDEAPAPDGTSCDDYNSDSLYDECLSGVCLGTVEDLCVDLTCPQELECQERVCESAVGAKFYTASNHFKGGFPLTCERAQTSQVGLNHVGIAVTCCDESGDASRPGCVSGLSYTNATAHCQSHGLRLCTLAEWQSNSTTFSGCAFDHHPNWLLDPCEGCLPEVVPDGTSCDDGDSQTSSDSCAAGVCQGAIIPDNQGTVDDDPHFHGFDGSRYDFNGVADNVFAIISDTHFQMNARFIAAPHSTYQTYMGELGFMLDQDRVEITPDYVKINGDLITSNKLYSLAPNGDAAVLVGEITQVRAGGYVVFVSVHETEGMKYLNIDSRASSDRIYHPHGLLGQTLAFILKGETPHPVRVNHRNFNSEGFIEGNALDYLVSDGLFGTNFRFNRFRVKTSHLDHQFSPRKQFQGSTTHYPTPDATYHHDKSRAKTGKSGKQKKSKKAEITVPIYQRGGH